MSRRPNKPAPVVVKRPADQRRKLPPELEAFARGDDEKLRIRRPHVDRGLIRDPREGYTIAGVANRDARAVYDVRASAMHALWDGGAADEGALRTLGQLFHDALRLELWHARRLTSFAAFAEEVVGVPVERAEALAEAAATLTGEPVSPLTEVAIALWLRTEAGLYEGDEGARCRIRAGERGLVLELTVDLGDASTALAGVGARHLPLARSVPQRQHEDRGPSDRGAAEDRGYASAARESRPDRAGQGPRDRSRDAGVLPQKYEESARFDERARYLEDDEAGASEADLDDGKIDVDDADHEADLESDDTDVDTLGAEDDEGDEEVDDGDAALSESSESEPEGGRSRGDDQVHEGHPSAQAERAPKRPAAPAQGARLLTRKTPPARQAPSAEDGAAEHWGRREPRETTTDRPDRPRIGHAGRGERSGFGDDRSGAGDRPRFDRGGDRSDRPKFGNGKSAGDRPRFDRGGSPSGDRTSFAGRNDRAAGGRADRPSFGDRKPGGDRPRFDRGGSAGGDRPAHGGRDRPSFGADRQGGNDRPRGGFNVERATASRADRGDRPRFGGDRPRPGAAGGFVKPQGGKFGHSDTRGGKPSHAKGGFTAGKPAFGKSAGKASGGGSKFGHADARGGKFGAQGGDKRGQQSGARAEQSGARAPQGKGFGARQAFGDKARGGEHPTRQGRRDDVDDE